MLALSAEARQLLEELRTVGGALQGLPQQKLDEDLAARVLQIAERRMLSPDEPDSSSAADKPSAGRAAALTRSADDASDGFPWREISWRGMFSPRAVIWSAIIVLVAVFLHYNAPPENGNRQQARLGEKKPAGASPVPVDDSKNNLGTHPAFRAPADQPKQASDDMIAVSGDGRKLGAKAEGSLRVEREKADGSEFNRDVAHGEQAAKAAAPARPGEEWRGEPTPEKPAAGVVANKDAGGGMGGMGGGGGAFRDEHRITAKKGGPSAEGFAANRAGQAAEKARRGKSSIQGQFGPRSGPRNCAAVPPAVAPPASAMPAQQSPVPPAAREVAKAGESPVESSATAKRDEQTTTTVKLTCSEAALRNGTFNAVLVRNGVVPRPVADVRQKAISQFQNYRIDNGNYAAGNAQAPLGTNGTTGSSYSLQQIAPQSLAGANQAKSGIAAEHRGRRSAAGCRRPTAGEFRSPRHSGQDRKQLQRAVWPSESGQYQRPECRTDGYHVERQQWRNQQWGCTVVLLRVRCHARSIGSSSKAAWRTAQRLFAAGSCLFNAHRVRGIRPPRP